MDVPESSTRLLLKMYNVHKLKMIANIMLYCVMNIHNYKSVEQYDGKVCFLLLFNFEYNYVAEREKSLLRNFGSRVIVLALFINTAINSNFIH